jgi:hypothetical protein
MDDEIAFYVRIGEDEIALFRHAPSMEEGREQLQKELDGARIRVAIPCRRRATVVRAAPGKPDAAHAVSEVPA